LAQITDPREQRKNYSLPSDVGYILRATEEHNLNHKNQPQTTTPSPRKQQTEDLKRHSTDTHFMPRRTSTNSSDEDDSSEEGITSLPILT
jgi:hypothetical protein